MPQRLKNPFTWIVLFCVLHTYKAQGQIADICAREVKIERLTINQFKQGEFFYSQHFIYHVFLSGGVIYLTQIDQHLNQSTRFTEKLSKKMMTLLDERYSPQFWIDSNLLYMKLEKVIFRWTIGESELSDQKEIPIKSYFNHPYMVRNGKIIFYDVYNHKDTDDAFLCFYDFQKNEATAYHALDFKFPAYTYIQPTNYISVSSSSFLFSQGIAYDIGIYDLEGKQTSSIQLNDTVHFPLLKKDEYEKYEEINRIYEHPKDYIPAIQNLLTKGSRIWSAEFITSTTIMVRFSRPTANADFEFVDDIWRLENDAWGLKQTVVHNERAKQNLDCSTIWPLHTFNSTYLIADGKLFYVVFNTTDKLLDINFKELAGLTEMTLDRLKIYTLDFNE